MMKSSGEGPVLVIGSSGVDIVGRACQDLKLGTSNPAHLRISHGGVARNVAENLARLGMEVQLITAVGDDDAGHRLLDEAAHIGIEAEHSLVSDDMPTGTYLAILDDRGNLHVGLDDMRVIQAISPEYLRQCRHLFAEAQALFVDGNLQPKALSQAIHLARQAKVPIAADPTTINLAPLFCRHLKDLWLLTPNETEAEVLCPVPVPHADTARAIEAAKHLVSEGVEIAIITLAEFGLVYATASTSGHVPAIQTEVLDPTGAGDALSAAVIFALLNEIPLDEAVRLGLSAASLTLKTEGTVVSDLSLELLYDQFL
jgi:pseudouridine kinase